MESIRTYFGLTLVAIYLTGMCSCIPVVDNTYVNTVFWYSIVGPDGWIKAVADSVGSVSYLGPYDYFVNITVSAEETTDTLQEYWQAEQDRLDLSSLWVSTAVIQESTTQVGNYNAVFIDYTYHMGTEITAREIIIVENGIAYVITYQAATDYYNDHLSEFETCLATFTIS